SGFCGVVQYVLCDAFDRLDAFDQHGSALADANAHGRQPAGFIFGLQTGQQGDDDARARGTQRVAQSDGSTPRVDDFWIDAQPANRSQRLGGEGFINLCDLAVVDGPAALAQNV